MNKGDHSAELMELFNSLCSGDTDVAQVIKVVEDFDEATVDQHLLNQVISIVEHDPRKNDFWETLLPCLSCESFNEKSLVYFFQNQLGIPSMCHKTIYR